MRHRLDDADLAEGEMRGYTLPGERRVLVARVGGSYAAIDDWCNHAGCLLSQGKLRGLEVICPCHGMTFDLRTGAASSVPRLCEDQRAYPVRIEEGSIWVEVD